MANETSFAGIIVAAYSDEEAADAVLKELKEAKKDRSFAFWDAAVIRKDDRSRYYYSESKDMEAPKGAGIGAVIGGLIGLTGGPAGAVIGAGLGAALGGLAANHDAGVKDERLEDIGHALQPGNSALLIVSDPEHLGVMREYAGDQETEEAVRKLTKGISEHMASGNNVAYMITSAGRSVSCHELDPDMAAAGLLNISNS
jgi:uncharacterized membrane protein